MSSSNALKYYNRFISDMDKNLKLIKTLNRINSNNNIPRTLVVKKVQVYLAYEVAFLKIYHSWQKFLMDTFILYLSDNTRNNKTKPRITFKGKNTKEIKSLISETFFGIENNRGEPQDIITNLNTKIFCNNLHRIVLNQMDFDLKEVRIIRNKIVHDSGQAENSFKNLLNKLGQNLSSNMTVGEFLSTINQQNNLSFLTHYYDVFKNGAFKISN
jgi:hypothetical protein